MIETNYYDLVPYKDASLMTWAIRWFSMGNDTFYDLYGFNFNPYKYPGLYEAARRRVYPQEYGRVWNGGLK